MEDRNVRRAPDYTTAALNMLGINLMWIFFVVWVLYGFVPVLVIAALIYHLINRLEQRYSDGGNGSGHAA